MTSRFSWTIIVRLYAWGAAWEAEEALIIGCQLVYLFVMNIYWLLFVAWTLMNGKRTSLCMHCTWFMLPRYRHTRTHPATYHNALGISRVALCALQQRASVAAIMRPSLGNRVKCCTPSVCPSLCPSISCPRRRSTLHITFQYTVHVEWTKGTWMWGMWQAEKYHKTKHFRRWKAFDRRYV